MKIRWAIKELDKSTMYREGGISGAKAIDIALFILRQVRDGELVPKRKSK